MKYILPAGCISRGESKNHNNQNEECESRGGGWAGSDFCFPKPPVFLFEDYFSKPIIRMAVEAIFRLREKETEIEWWRSSEA